MQWYEAEEMHEEGKKSLFQKMGFVNSKGVVMKFHPKFYDEWDKMGHDSLDFEQCKCRQKITQHRPPSNWNGLRKHAV